MRIVDGSEGRPTQQAYAVKAQLSTAIETQLNALEELWTQRLPALNQQVRDSGLELVSVAGD